jgi:ppGpp synthetase/RelA/SpoT-type nucleotidyltranferase
LNMSKSHINKCGKLLRDALEGQAEVDSESYQHAIDVVTEFRRLHAYPMTKVRMGLASMVNTEQIDGAVTQRHKRVPRIVRKLQRMPGTSLARLEDIAGCRVVVATPAEMDRLCRRIRRNYAREFTREPRDYVANPKPIGYRAIHFVVLRDMRAVEIQVRTSAQQRWAEAVEALDARRSDLNLKDGIGPDDITEYFAVAGEVLYRQEYDLPISEALLDRMRLAQDAVVEAGYYRRRD